MRRQFLAVKIRVRLPTGCRAIWINQVAERRWAEVAMGLKDPAEVVSITKTTLRSDLLNA